MKSSGLMIAALVLLALSGVLYWSNHHAPAKEAAASSVESPAKLVTVNESDAAKIIIRKKGTDALVITRNSAGKWEITAPRVLGADQEAVSGVVSALSSLSSERLIEDKSGNLSQFGLSDPSLEVDVSDKQNKTQKLLIGDDTPTGSAAYAALVGDPRVFTVASYNKTSLDKSPNDLRDKRLMSIEPDKISRVELTARNQTIEFGRNKDQWQILKPGPFRADASQVDDLVRKLTEAKMDLSGAGSGSDAGTEKSVSAFTSGTPVASARLTAESGTQQLQVRKNKENYYAKSSIVGGAYKVASDLAQALDKSLDDFRNKKLFDFGIDDPAKIEMRESTRALSLTKSGRDWWADGKKMEVASVQLFVDKLRALSAAKFVQSGFSDGSIEIAVISQEGKRNEKVIIAKNRSHYVAKRENEAALYEVDSKAVEELQKSAANVKPAVASAK